MIYRKRQEGFFMVDCYDRARENKRKSIYRETETGIRGRREPGRRYADGRYADGRPAEKRNSQSISPARKKMRQKQRRDRMVKRFCTLAAELALGSCFSLWYPGSAPRS